MVNSIKSIIPYFISAGEPSGDILASELVIALNNISDDFVPYGICGKAMVEVGVNPIGFNDTIAVMGFFEVLKKLWDINLFIQKVLHYIDRINPAFAILVDSPGFHFVLAKELKKRGIKVIEYVAPQVWAWGHHRVKRLSQLFDMILGILPFEEEFFKGRGIKNFYYVGTPHLDRAMNAQDLKPIFKIEDNAPVVSFFPGSRVSEVVSIMPIFLKVIQYIRNKNLKAHIYVSVAQSLKINLENRYAEEAKNLNFYFIRGKSVDLMKTSDVAVVTSGTATLECAFCKTPMVVVYKMNHLTYFLARSLVKLDYISLVNFMACKKIVSEYIQYFSISTLAEEVISFMLDEDKRISMIKEFNKLESKVRCNTSINAARLVVKYLNTSC